MSTTLLYLEDHTVLFTNATAKKTSGAVVEIGAEKLIGVIKGDVTTTGTVAAYIRGVHELAKTASTDLAAGEKVFWDTSASKFTTVSTGNVAAGFAYAAATTGATTAKIVLLPTVKG